MAFDDSNIVDVTVTPVDAEVVVAWSSSDPAGTLFQVYENGEHVWSGTARSAHLPRPSGRTQYAVGAVGPGEKDVNFASSLPVPPGGGSRITLTWQGGTFLSPDIAGFRVYMGTVPGGAVDYSSPVGTVPAYTQAAKTDGFGMGRFGAGGFGYASANYSWTSGLLRSGTWNAAVVPYDRLGNQGTPMTTSAVLAGPPLPIPRWPSGVRISYTINPGAAGGFGTSAFGTSAFGSYGGSPFATLNWQASPGL